MNGVSQVFQRLLRHKMDLNAAISNSYVNIPCRELGRSEAKPALDEPDCMVDVEDRPRVMAWSDRARVASEF